MIGVDPVSALACELYGENARVIYERGFGRSVVAGVVVGEDWAHPDSYAIADTGWEAEGRLLKKLLAVADRRVSVLLDVIHEAEAA